LHPAFEIGATLDEPGELIAAGRHPILVAEGGHREVERGDRA
jgi:hypothetical protein